MIVDASALVAIVREEPDADVYLAALAGGGPRAISAGNLLEASIVLDGSRNPVISRRFDQVFARLRLLVEPVTERQASIARAAYRDFGRGSGHPAKLNFGDCFAYALAKDLDQPLLYKGDDFGHTDVRPALPRS